MRHNLKIARNNAGLTQKDLAKKLKMSIRQYQRIESGESNGSVDTWDYLEDIFKTNQRVLRDNSIFPKDNPQ